jgi:hypothetical protein
LTDSFSDEVTQFDAETGALQTIATRASDPAFWDPSGDRLSYRKFDADVTYFDFAANTEVQIADLGFNDPDDLIYPVGWSHDSQNVIYSRAVIGIGTISTTYEYYLLDWTTQTSTILGTYQTGSPLTGVPLKPELARIPLIGILQEKRNPVRDEWVAMQFLLGDENEEEGTVLLIYVHVLWNFVTGQMISLDELFEDDISTSSLDWSADGKYLLVSTSGLSSQIESSQAHIVQFRSDDTLTIKASAHIGNHDGPYYFLDAGHLIVSYDGDAATADNESAFVIGEIIDGEWFETDFFRMTGFYPLGDWRITASEEEKKTLSCTFDQTLPARLQVGERGRVAFTGGTPSRLRAEPGTNGAVLLQMSEGTAFDVLATPECRDGYRWWHLGLEDDTVGYAAEATMEEYFLEPIE